MVSLSISSDSEVGVNISSATNVYTFLSAYGQVNPAPTPEGADYALHVLGDYERWDTYAFPVELAILTWMGDILVVRSQLNLK